MEAAVHGQYLPRHIAGGVAREESRASRHSLGGAETPEWCPPQVLLLHGILKPLSHFRIDESGRYSIDPDSSRTKFLRQRLREPDDPRLCGDVCALTGVADHRYDRRNIDDRAAFLRQHCLSRRGGEIKHALE